MKVVRDEKGVVKRVEWLDQREEIRNALWPRMADGSRRHLDLHQTFRFWAALHKKFAMMGRELDFYRNLGEVDRFFLVINVLKRHDILKKGPAAIEWLFNRCREVEADPDGFLDLWPRDHFKSSMITQAGIVQEIIKNQNITCAIFSHTARVATKFLEQIMDSLSQCEKLWEAWPEIFYENPKKQASMWNKKSGFKVKRSTTAKEATVEAYGVVDNQPTGMHFQLRVYDDLVTVESVNTAEQIERTTERFFLSENLGSSESARRWMVGTRYSFADSYSELMAADIVKVRKFSATDNGEIDGKPVFLTPEQWKEKLKQDISVVACQQLMNPQAGGRALFDLRTLGTYDIFPTVLNIYITIDPARSLGKRADSTAMAVIGVDSSENLYILDGVCHKMTLEQQWAWLKKLYCRWEWRGQTIKVGCETVGLAQLSEYFRLQMEREKIYFKIHDLHWRGGTNERVKTDKMRRLQPAIRKGKLLLPSVCRGVDGKRKYWRFVGAETRIDERQRLAEEKSARLLAEAEGRAWEQPKPVSKDVLWVEKRFEGPRGAMKLSRENCADWIVCEDPTNENKPYDFCKVFVHQAQLAPFGKHDDAVDCISMVYSPELEMRPPTDGDLVSVQSRVPAYADD